MTNLKFDLETVSSGQALCLETSHFALEAKIEATVTKPAPHIIHVSGHAFAFIKGIRKKLVEYKTEAVWEKIFPQGIPLEGEEATSLHSIDHPDRQWRMLSMNDWDVLRGVRHEWIVDDQFKHATFIRRENGKEVRREIVLSNPGDTTRQSEILDPVSLLIGLGRIKNQGQQKFFGEAFTVQGLSKIIFQFDSGKINLLSYAAEKKEIDLSENKICFEINSDSKRIERASLEFKSKLLGNTKILFSEKYATEPQLNQ